MADSKNPNKVLLIVDLIEYTVEVWLLAVDELTNGGVIVRHHPHARCNLQLENEIFQAIEPTSSGRRLLGIDVSIESGKILKRGS